MRLELETPVRFQGKLVPNGAQLAGWAALVHASGLQAPVRQPSCVSQKHIGGSQREEGGFRVFDKRYQPGDDVADQLTFALRHENIDLLILKRTFEAVPRAALEDYVRSKPTGTHTRRAWFFYEMLTGQTSASTTLNSSLLYVSTTIASVPTCLDHCKLGFSSAFG